MQPLNMQETLKVIGNLEENEKTKQLEKFIKKFSKIKTEKAEALDKEISELGLLKLKKEHIVKIVDLLPENTTDLSKIFTDISLDEDETDKILGVVKKYR